ncbi:hypothetical protein B0O99DRAFT_606493 [Bisporella sp. PMI_857]|nr:hypothetical protein B0O99DRAFT_606493 [Bisporella sp. PMI_857]
MAMQGDSPPAASHDLNNEAPGIGAQQPGSATPFPALNEPSSLSSPHGSLNNATRNRGTSSTSTLKTRLRAVSDSFQQSAPPPGFSVATGQIANAMPSMADIRRGSYSSDGWSGEGQVIEKERRASLSRGQSSQGEAPLQSHTNVRHEIVPEVDEEHANSDTTSGAKGTNDETIESITSGGSTKHDTTTDTAKGYKLEARTTPFENGYQFPPKHTWGESTKIFLIASWKFFITPVGFLVVIYGLNIVAWGGMLFLLLCNASPAMCKPTCNDINSPRRIWIEIDSQILNALFCVTGFGTIPWRFRDLYYLLQYRIQKKDIGLRRLAGINRGWFRLAGSEQLPIRIGPSNIEAELANVPETSIAFPPSKTADAPLTGIRAPPTKLWKLDFVIWAMVWNTFLQAVLSGFMWGLNRYDRPSWSTGLFVALACIVAAAGGIMSFIEGKHVKAIEGVPVSEEDQERLKRDNELGITHWNNIKGEKPKEPKEKSTDSGFFRRKNNIAGGTA